jgi:hypothetical protein
VWHESCYRIIDRIAVGGIILKKHLQEAVKVIHWGLGAMGQGMAKLVLNRPGLEPVGAIVSTPHKVGKDLGTLLGLEKPLDIIALDDYQAVLGGTDADVVLLATSSFVKDVAPQIKAAITRGKNVITIAEEMAYPWVDAPEESTEIDALARKHGVTVLGTGINPGFVLDTLIIALSGVCFDIQAIKARRVNDLSPFGPTVMRTQGVGTTPAEFAAGLKAGSIVGHIGFRQSISLLAAALGWELDEIKEEREPIISKTHRETAHVKVAPGMVAGCKHTGYGLKDGKALITLEHPQQIQPEKEDIATGDYITIEGEPTIKLQIRPELPGGIGTIAIAVNMIPQVIQAPPRLVTMKDLPVPAAYLGSAAKYFA